MLEDYNSDKTCLLQCVRAPHYAFRVLGPHETQQIDETSQRARSFIVNDLAHPDGDQLQHLSPHLAIS